MRIKIPRRFIGEDHRRVVDQRLGNGHTLLLAADNSFGRCSTRSSRLTRVSASRAIYLRSWREIPA
jgi:hypothetical protein